jgi:hypothetical protein
MDPTTNPPSRCLPNDVDQIHGLIIIIRIIEDKKEWLYIYIYMHVFQISNFFINNFFCVGGYDGGIQL